MQEEKAMSIIEKKKLTLTLHTYNGISDEFMSVSLVRVSDHVAESFDI